MTRPATATAAAPRRTRTARRRRPPPAALGRLLVLGLARPPPACRAYHRAPCSRDAVRRQFQFSDCYVPNLNPDLALGRASFVMSHDAATGYLNVKGTGGDGTDGEDGGDDAAYGGAYDGVDDMNGGEYDGYEDGGNFYGQNSNTQSHPSRWNTITTQLLSLYGKTQAGSVYDQLNDGARALDLRPKIYSNGTVGFHHGSLIDVPLDSVTLASLLEDAKQWCNDNPKELVIIFHSELVHEAGYNGLSSQVYLEVDDDDVAADDVVADDAAADDADDADAAADADADDADDAAAYADDAYADDAQADDAGADDAQYKYQYFYSGIATLRARYAASGVPYHPCEKLAGLTVADALELADLSRTGGQGYLLAVDRHDMYASFCGKANWATDQLVTCHSRYRYYGQAQQDEEGRDAEGGNGAGDARGSYVHCTDTTGTGVSKLSSLLAYVTASTNNEASDDGDALGPPADEAYYPFNQIQGFWQVDAASVQIGIMHASTLLDDNRRSRVNEEMVTHAYNEKFDAISVFALDNVALDGNALFSVLRNACGQSVLKDDGDAPACGRDLVIPNMRVSHRLPLVWNVVLFVVYGSLVAMVSVMLFQAFRLRNEGPQEHRLICHGHVV